MGQIVKRWLSAALVLALMLCVLPAEAFAAEDDLVISSVKIVFSDGTVKGTAWSSTGVATTYYGELRAAPFGEYEFYFMINDDPNLTFGGTTAADGTLSNAVAGETVKFTVPEFEAPYDCVDIDIEFNVPEMTFSVEYQKKIDISKGTAEYIGDRTYNGDRQSPLGCSEEVRLILNGAELIPDTDYVINGSTVLLVGGAPCTVSGRGEYSGKMEVPFIIKPLPLTVTLADQTIHYGESIALDAYTVEGLLEGDTFIIEKLTASTTEITDSGEITLGRYDYDIRNESADQYSRERRSCYDVTVIPGKLTILGTPITDAEVTLGQSEYDYDGSEKKPAVTVTLDGTELVKGSDYQVTYSNNTEVGTGIITVEGLGKYTGTVEKTFTILPKEITAEISVKDRDYDGTKDAQIESAALVGAVAGDDVTLIQGTASFSDVEGEDLPVTFTGFSLSGADAGNYTLVLPTNVTGTINPKPVETTTPTTEPEETTEATTAPTTQPPVTVPPTDGSPATGDTAMVGLPILGILVSVLGLVMMFYRRKKQMQ